MAGLAAALNAPKTIDAIAWALAARGSEGSVCRLAGPGGTTLDLAVRAGMPAITRVVDEAAADGAGDRPIAALAVDGIASVTALDGAYSEHGPAGLVDEREQHYAVVLADAQRGELVLARNGSGPSLYYARLDDGWVVASEPTALVHAGVEAEPDVAVIRRFIQTGDCDESERTFFARIRRVLPGEAIVLSTAVSGPLRHPIRWAPADPVPVEDAMWQASAGSRVGVLVTPGIGGAAVLGAALHHPEHRAPVSVFTAALDGVDEADTGVPAMLEALAPAATRYIPVTARLDLPTIDRFLRDMGEPVPDLGVYLLWTVARELSGDVQTLVDATTGPLAGWERVTERMLAHFGVTVRAPLRGTPPDEDLLISVLRRTLAPRAAQHVRVGGPDGDLAARVVRALHEEVAAALVPPRPWSDAAASVTALRRLLSGEPVDGGALLRAFLVERWLAGFGPDVEVPAEPELRPIATLPQTAVRAPDDVVVGDQAWRRIPVRTAPIASGDQLLANAAFYVVNALSAHEEKPAGPWFAVVSGKVVAVSQKRVNPVAAVQPGRTARLLARLVARRWPQLALPQAMQVAIDQSGASRILAAWVFGGPLPARSRVYPPRAGAMAPADTAVVQPPYQSDEVAASLAAAVRLAVAHEYGRLLAGVAVVSADGTGCHVLGFAPGPAADAIDSPRRLLSLLLADNPAGQDAQRTPIVIVAQRPPVPVDRALLSVDRHADLATRAR